MNRLFRWTLLFGVFIAALVPAWAQNELKILRVDTDHYPTIKVYVRAFCNGVQVLNLGSFSVSLRDGSIIRASRLHCPATTLPISVSLVLDRSSSMSGTAMYMVQQGAKDFVDLMTSHPTGDDEAAIISFNQSVRTDANMTANKSPLYNAIGQLLALGNTAVWDAVMEGIFEVTTKGTNAIKAVIVLSDGGDNKSKASLADVIAYAKREGIPVYCIGIAEMDEDWLWQLQILAQQTGGMYIRIDDPLDIKTVFVALASIISQGVNDCILEYELDCMDGSEHTVYVQTDACGGMTASAKFHVPVSPNLGRVTMALDSITTYGDSTFTMPIILGTTVPLQTMNRLAFTIVVPPPLEYDGYVTTGYTGDQLIIVPSVIDQKVSFDMQGTLTLYPHDTLMLLRFRVPALKKDSLIRLPFLSYEKATDSCLAMVTKDGTVRVVRRPRLDPQCQDTTTVRWDKTKGRYEPDLVTISATITNTFGILARNPRARIILPYGVELITPRNPIPLLANPFPANGRETVTFTVRVKTSDSAKVLPICIEILSDGGYVGTCCSYLAIDAATPWLEAQCWMPQAVRWNDSTDSYDPPTFPVVVKVSNRSPYPARSGKVWLQTPTDVQIVGSPPMVSITPSILNLNDSAQIVFTVKPLDRPTADSVRFCFMAVAGGDTIWCCRTVYMEASRLRPVLTCTEPIAILFDEEKGTFDPPLFSVSTLLFNTTKFAFSDVRASVDLPPFLDLGVGEWKDKLLSNGAYIMPGDSVRVGWKLYSRTRSDQTGVICVTISATNVKPTVCCIPVTLTVKPAIPSIACALEGPDTIRYTPSGYVPNPARFVLRVMNTGVIPAKVLYGALLQGADVSIDSNDIALKKITDSLAVGDTVVATFDVRFLRRYVARTDSVRVTVYAANGGAVLCERPVYVEAVLQPGVELICHGPDTLVFLDSARHYDPDPFVISLEAWNPSTFTADSVVAQILLPPSLSLASGEQPEKPLQPGSLGPNERGTASWRVTAQLRDIGTQDTIYTRVRIKGTLFDPPVPCPVIIRVPPITNPVLDVACRLREPIRVVGAGYEPNPVPIDLEVTNTGTGSAFQVRATLLDNDRLTLASGDSVSKFRPRIRENGGSTLYTWYVVPKSTFTGDTVQLCMRVTADNHRDLFCCTQVIIPPLEQPSLSVSCRLPLDTIAPDPITKKYPSPVQFRVTITNPGAQVVAPVRATLLLPSSVEFSTGVTPEQVIPSLNPGAKQDLVWNTEIVRDTSTVAKVRTWKVQILADGSVVTCEASLVVMPVVLDSSGLEVTCASPARIRYVNAQVGLSPSPFTVTVEVRNSGILPLHNLTATLRLPDGVSLSSGEQLAKTLTQDLDPGVRTAFQWSVVPSLTVTMQNLNFEFLVGATDVREVSCASPTVVEPMVRIIRLQIPEGNVARAGTTTAVPVLFSNPDRVQVREFSFGVQFDPAVVDLTAISTEGVLTSGWGDRVTLAEEVAGRVRIHGSSAVPILDDGTLVHLVFRVTSGDGSTNPFGYKRSDLLLLHPQVADTATVVVTPGDILTSGDCLYPLQAGERYALFPNRPNPFNPSTALEYRIEGVTTSVYVRLEVVDMLGRIVRVVDEGWREAGTHRVWFDGTGLPSGLYVSRLHVEGQVHERRMVLAK